MGQGMEGGSVRGTGASGNRWARAPAEPTATDDRTNAPVRSFRDMATPRDASVPLSLRPRNDPYSSPRGLPRFYRRGSGPGGTARAGGGGPPKKGPVGVPA